MLNPVRIKVDTAVLNLGTARCPLAVHSAPPPPLPLMSSRRLGRALQWGNNVAVKQRGCDSPSTLRTPPPSLLLPLFSSVDAPARRPPPSPYSPLKAAAPALDSLETDSFSPRHLICGNRCYTAGRGCASERARERCERHIRQKCSSSVERSEMPECPLLPSVSLSLRPIVQGTGVDG